MAPANVRTLGPFPPRVQTRDRALNRIQQAVRQAFTKVKANPFADGQLIPGVSFTGGTPLAIAHGLGRAWQGYMVVNVADNAAAFKRAAPNSATDPFTITLTASASCTADVWVY